MKELSILLALDGSVQCRNAMDLCFGLVKGTSARITAQHVANTAGLWNFLAFDKPGLVGSGPYLGAYEVMRRELLSIGETLAEVYKTRADSAGVRVDCQIDEGNVVREVYRRSQDHDLVVIGHRPIAMRSPAGDRPKSASHSVAERLVYYINKPLLVIQDEVVVWKSITMVVPTEGAFLNPIAGCAQLGSVLSLPVNVCFWAQSDEDEERVSRLVQKLDESLKSSSTSRPEIKVVKGEPHWWMPNIEVAANSLLVIPTSEQTGRRETSFGTPPDLLLRHFRQPAVMFWPDGMSRGSLEGAEMEEEREAIAAD